MNGLDLLILVFVLVILLRGARMGFLAGAFSLAGVVLGASLGSRLASFLVPEGEGPVFTAVVTLASIVAFAALGDALARAIGGSLRDRLRSPASEVLDGLGGAALGLVLSLTVVWVAGLVILHAPLPGLRPAAEDSRILLALNERMPSEFLTRAVAQLDPLPQVPGPEAEVADPDEGVARDPEVLAAASGTVRINGVACGYGVEGSGWVAAPDLVVTNAHVVAGEASTWVQPGGEGLNERAEVVLFDDRNDIAVLRVEDLGIRPMPLAEPRAGEAVAVLGFPQNGPLDVRPGRTGATRPVTSSDAYNRGPVERTVTTFRVYVRPGNSGGPAVNEEGEVVATIFASRADSEDYGFGIPSQVVQRRLQIAAGRTEPVGTGVCAS